MVNQWVVLCWVGDGFLACLRTWFRSSSLFKDFDLWFLSGLLKFAYFLAFDLPPSRRWSCGCYVVSDRFGCFCSVCCFILFILFVLVLIRDWVIGYVTLFCGGSVSWTRKGLIRLVRKGLVSDVLDSSLDLSSYALLARKSFLCLLLFRELSTLGFWYRVSGRTVRHFYTLTVLCNVHFSFFFVTWFRSPTWVHWVAYVISEFLL